jgi:hypothetical protein
MKHIKLFSLLLVLCLACTCLLTACKGDNGGDESKEDQSSVGEKNPYVDGNGRYTGSFESKYEGQTITFLTCSVNPTYESEILYNPYADSKKDKYEDGTNVTMPEVLNDNLKYRAEFVEETLGVTVEEVKLHQTQRPGGEMVQTIREGNLSATTDYQIIVPCLYDAANLAVDGQLYNLLGKGFDTFQSEAPWWNQDFNKSMTYGGQLYFTIGDLGIGNKSSTAALYVNIDLWKKLGLVEKFGGTPYDLVREGKWTVDTVFEAAQNLSKDEDNSSVIDYKDSFGWGGQLDDMWSIFYASGERIAQAGADGYPTLTMFNERSAKLMESLQEFVQNKKYYISANDYFGIVQWPTVLVQEAFTSGRAIFYNGNVGTVIELGVMEQHFGIVPVPKADETQDTYYSLVNPWTSTCFAVPTCVVGEELQKTVDVLNVMGAESMNTVSVHYKEILEYMKTRDDDSVDMLNNYILPNRGCDVGLVYKWGALDTLLQTMASQTVGTFASQYDTKKEAAQNALDETVEFFKDNTK